MAKFVIKAGHDINKDPGACDPVQPWEGDYIDTKEAVWCREVALLTCDVAKSKGHQAIFMQDDDLDLICRMASESGADAFVDLHLNAAANTSALGPETYCYPGSKAGKHLAGCVHEKLIANLGAQQRDRHVREANFKVLRDTSMPAILVEAGFITNVWEESIIHQDWYKKAVAEAIVDGCLKFVGEE
ncbi:N-acetylmuramoyl-L-alanine amidase [Sporomusa sphaeroides DSM 2875]|uniref:N-acetylmuramoyl-L-alanine amidase family protein n=1 Tax=Sporomusa sphaeroides TaxID=47679 RepID=UPI00202E52F2|nr:N-acetylmuramoyl-L-alanine amidase [Sporomusa sphaeroides]MCM0760258.1 N-acetylmuramoyl-L-alanine amidase [Sporomusa sphaeroides DSM 2875]